MIFCINENRAHAASATYRSSFSPPFTASSDVARGKAAGVEENHIKLDHERLVDFVYRLARTAAAA